MDGTTVAETVAVLDDRQQEALRGTLASEIAESLDDELEEADLSHVSDCEDCVWAVMIDDRVVGQVSILGEGQHLARIRTFRVHPAWQHTSVPAKLIDRVHQHCWDHGYLKIAFDAQVAPAVLRRMFEHRGFHLSPHRQSDNGEPLEYYVDLYVPPKRSA